MYLFVYMHGFINKPTFTILGCIFKQKYLLKLFFYPARVYFSRAKSSALFRAYERPWPTGQGQ